MVMGHWWVQALYGVVEIDEVKDVFFINDQWQTPQLVPWHPPPEPSYYNDEQEASHLEVDQTRLPVWAPWRPIPHQDYFEQSGILEEFITPEKYEAPWRLPVHPIPRLQFPWQPQEEEPIPDAEPYLDQRIVLPVPPPHFMPPTIPFEIDLPARPGKCPPPCLRRPDKKC